MTVSATPVVFIHGLWLHATSWNPRLKVFSERRYAPVAPGRPGDRPRVAETRFNPDAVAGSGIDDVTAYPRALTDELHTRPIPIGHSFDGMISEQLLDENDGAAAIGIDAAPIKGVSLLPLSAPHSTSPVFKNLANKNWAVTVTPGQFRYAFANAVTEEESKVLFDQETVAAPSDPLFEAAAANFSLHSSDKVNTDNAERDPLLLVMGGRDCTVPEAITRSTLKKYEHYTAVADLIELEDRGHSLTIDSEWQDVDGAGLTGPSKDGLCS